MGAAVADCCPKPQANGSFIALFGDIESESAKLLWGFLTVYETCIQHHRPDSQQESGRWTMTGESASNWEQTTFPRGALWPLSVGSSQETTPVALFRNR